MASEEQVAGAVERWKSCHVDYRRDHYGYELSDEKLAKISRWVLDQDVLEPLELVEPLGLAMILGEVPGLASGYDTFAEDDLLHTVIVIIQGR